MSVKQMVCSNKHVDTWACNTICWAVDCLCALFATRVAISNGTGVVWVLAVAQIVVLGAVAAVFVVIIGDDVAAEHGGSGCKREDWGACWGAVG